MEHSTGNLKPGVQYVYTWEHGIVYAQESDQERFVIGWQYVPIDIQSRPIKIYE